MFLQALTAEGMKTRYGFGFGVSIPTDRTRETPSQTADCQTTMKSTTPVCCVCDSEKSWINRFSLYFHQAARQIELSYSLRSWQDFARAGVLLFWRRSQAWRKSKMCEGIGEKPSWEATVDNQEIFPGEITGRYSPNFKGFCFFNTKGIWRIRSTIAFIWL